MEVTSVSPNIFNRYLIFLFVVLFILSTGKTFSQDYYRTNAGSLIIRVNQNNELVTINSKKLLIILDYETGKLTMTQKVSDLSTSNNAIQSWLEGHPDETITFEGKLGLDYINTTGHAPLDFPVEGTLSPGENRIMGDGHLVHRTGKMSASCLLSMTFQIKLDSVFPGLDLKGINNDVYIQIVQSLLGRINDR